MADVRSPLIELTIARMREFVRDPGAMFWTFGFPVLLAMALGLAFRASPPPKLRAAIVCGANCTLSSRELEVEKKERAAALDELRKAKLDLVVEIADTGARTYHFDPTRPEGRAAQLAAKLALRPADETPTNETEVLHTEPGARYIDFLVPGLLGLNLMGSAIFGIGFSVVEARRRKLLKQLAATPMKKSHFLASFMLSRLVFLVIEVAALVGFGALAFDVPVRGTVAAIAVVSLVGSVSFTGIALAIAAFPKTTEVANGLSNLVMLPMWLLSGSFFSYERFPEGVLPWIKALPLTALNDALRLVINDGLSIVDCRAQLGVLIAWAVVSFTLALKTFRWQ